LKAANAESLAGSNGDDGSASPIERIDAIRGPRAPGIRADVAAQALRVASGRGIVIVNVNA